MISFSRYDKEIAAANRKMYNAFLLPFTSFRNFITLVFLRSLSVTESWVELAIDFWITCEQLPVIDFCGYLSREKKMFLYPYILLKNMFVHLYVYISSKWNWQQKESLELRENVLFCNIFLFEYHSNWTRNYFWVLKDLKIYSKSELLLELSNWIFGCRVNYNT